MRTLVWYLRLHYHTYAGIVWEQRGRKFFNWRRRNAFVESLKWRSLTSTQWLYILTIIYTKHAMNWLYWNHYCRKSVKVRIKKFRRRIWSKRCSCSIFNIVYRQTLYMEQVSLNYWPVYIAVNVLARSVLGLSIYKLRTPIRCQELNIV